LQGENGKLQPNPRPSFEPENTEAQQAVALGEALLQFSDQIANHCKQAPALPDLNRLILERDQVLGKLTALPVNKLPENVREWLVACLRRCQTVDQENLSNLQALHSTWGTQLQSMKEGSNLMDKYRIASRQQSTRWEDA
jgi:hypothetical protein